MIKVKTFSTGTVLLFLLFTIVAVLVGELAIRFLFPQTTFYPRYVVSSEYPISFPVDSELIHAQGWRWKFVYHTNKLGRRGEYYPISEDYQTTNVVVLGDSFTFGTGVNDRDVYTEIMSERLTDTYAVINGGMSGWGIDSEIKWYFKTGRLYRPKYVVLQFTANNPNDSFSGVTTIENGVFAFHSNPSTRPAWQLFLSRSYIIQNSHLYSLLRSAFDPAQRMASRTGNSELEDNNLQSNYVDLLRLFANKLDEQGSQLIF